MTKMERISNMMLEEARYTNRKIDTLLTSGEYDLARKARTDFINKMCGVQEMAIIFGYTIDYDIEKRFIHYVTVYKATKSGIKEIKRYA